MYYCTNCRSYFEHPITVFEPYEDYGGEYFSACPCCHIAEMFILEESQCRENE